MNKLRQNNYWQFSKDDGDDKKDPAPIKPPKTGEDGG